MKDLVDVVYYIMNISLPLDSLAHSIQYECSKRGMAVPECFEVPRDWAGGFAAFAKKAAFPRSTPRLMQHHRSYPRSSTPPSTVLSIMGPYGTSNRCAGCRKTRVVRYGKASPYGKRNL